ncbi:PEP-CTERM sorting domain-containing protein [Teredinibacter haidensis]|uniref:PEP-CTERM sorting domain-containing protein n=1 Tax=Teredinibacter haidensis TaxID=2731755 RepID=UPI000948BA57|nr:PEP-CTERM sorting domain-containing protein [Teredinibacter haidensis]
MQKRNLVVKIGRACLAMALTAFASYTQATTITYDFSTKNIGTFSDTALLTGSDSSTLTATAFARTDTGATVEARLGAAPGYGLYVCSDSNLDGTHRHFMSCGFDTFFSPEDIYPVDGEDNIDEGIKLAFNDGNDYQLKSASFFVYDSWWVGEHDESGNGSDIYADSSKLGTALFNVNNLFSDCVNSGRNPSNLGNYYDCTFNSGALVANNFSFVASEPVHKFKLKNIVVETVSVAEPGTLALLGIGILGLSLCRSRRLS